MKISDFKVGDILWIELSGNLLRMSSVPYVSCEVVKTGKKYVYVCEGNSSRVLKFQLSERGGESGLEEVVVDYIPERYIRLSKKYIEEKIEQKELMHSIRWKLGVLDGAGGFNKCDIGTVREINSLLDYLMDDYNKMMNTRKVSRR